MIVNEECVRKCEPCRTSESGLYQDSQYGKGMRVHTPLKRAKLDIPQKWRCTICGSVR